MTALYQLSGQFAAIMAQIAEAEGELTPELEALLDDAGVALAEKVDAVAAFVRERRAHAESCRGEAKFFADKAKAFDAKADALEAYLLRCITEAGLPAVDGKRFRVARRLNPVAVVLDVKADALPEAYRRTKTTIEADKAAIKKALESGEEIAGAKLVRNERVEIK